MKKELYHSERYLGQEFSDELYHWKYLSRKRKNGRWVYTYAKKAKNFINEKKPSRSDYPTFAETTKSSVGDYINGRKTNYDDEKVWNVINQKTGKIVWNERLTRNNAQNMAMEYNNEANRRYKAALNDYYNRHKLTNLKDISKETIKKGKNKVSKILRNLADSI